MNWDAISGTAEILGAMGVIVSLGYLAVQIRYSNAIGRASAYRDLHQDIGAVITEVAKDPELHRVWRTGLFSDEPLSVDDNDRLGMLLHQIFGALNAGYQSSWQDPNIANYVAKVTDLYISVPHVQAWWSRHRNSHPEPFMSFVDARLTASKDGN